ncbi:hypothetical protein CL646_03690 [bacterium]|jgi:hypothetical protein|nr:hypothetical protein [bacterium]|tara:strand:+ start:10175 stop:11527 length:1353 start_codon:yes stop_codon:yes gene_type:complete
MCDTSGPDTGAIISLNAIGKQDTYLLENETTNSLFNYDVKRHSNFRKFHKSTNVIKPGNAKASWPFDETIKVTLNPRNMGDLLSNMYISMELPGLPSGGGNDYYYADQVGRHVIESITMRIDETIIETFHSDWGIIYDELYLDESEKRTKRYTVNRNLAEDTALSAGNQIFSQFKSKLFIPIPFFFSRKYEGDEYDTNKPNRPYFPTCAINKQKIQFDIKFRPQTFFTDYTGTISLNSFDIVTEEITLENSERSYIKNNKHILITDFVQRHPSTVIKAGETSAKLELVPKIPVKSINWFFRREEFEDEKIFTGGNNLLANVFANRYNFSSNVQYSIINEFYNPPMLSAKIFINGEDVPGFQDSDHKYYKYTVPLSNRLSRPFRNIYTYAFSMNPINVEPSGSLDFSQLKSNKTVLDVKMVNGLTSDYTLNMYYVGYQTLSFENGFMVRAY